MIVGFADRATQRFFNDGVCPAAWRPFAAAAARKLDMLNAAAGIDDLRSPPGNRLGRLKGDRAGQWSIRINAQWRVCFTWTEHGPDNVAIVDYH
jgi:proteic killer suppression protein